MDQLNSFIDLTCLFTLPSNINSITTKASTASFNSARCNFLFYLLSLKLNIARLLVSDTQYEMYVQILKYLHIRMSTAFSVMFFLLFALLLAKVVALGC